MNTKQTILFGVLALIGGVIGGMLSDVLPGFAVAKSDVEKVVRAENFQLVDSEGNVRAYLANIGEEDTVFAIGGSARTPRKSYLTIYNSPSSTELLIRTKESNGISIDSSEKGAKIELVGSNLQTDKKMLMAVDTDGNPTLQLLENRYEKRVVLGKTELKNTKTGSTEIRSTGSIVIFDEEGKVVYSVP